MKGKGLTDRKKKEMVEIILREYAPKANKARAVAEKKVMEAKLAAPKS